MPTRLSFPGSAAYGSMKGAVEVLTRQLAKELGPRRITANVVAPGAIATDFGHGRVRDNKELNQQVASVTALGRVGLPEDIGGVVVFLHTEEARWINGQHIEVLGDMCCNIRRKDQKLLGICGHISCSPSGFSFGRSRKLNQGQSGIE